MADYNNQKLELTCIGKDEQPKLEPRIFIEDSEKSYGHPPNPLPRGEFEEEPFQKDKK